MARIAIDISSTQDQFAHRGVGMYTRQLVQQLISSNKSDHKWELIGFGTESELKENLNQIANKIGTEVTFHSLSDRIIPTSPRNVIDWPRQWIPKIRQIKPDVYFCPEMQRGVPIGLTKTLTTIHDVIPVVTGSYGSHTGIMNTLKGIYYRRQLSSASKSDQITVPSVFTKQEITKLYPSIEGKVAAVHLGVEKLPTDSSLDLYNRFSIPTTRRIIHYNGGLEKNKNVPLLITSFAKVLQRVQNVHLVIVGGMFGFDESGKTRAKTLLAEQLLELINSEDRKSPATKLKDHITFTGYLTDPELGELYDLSDLFVHLSGYEGFGFSVLQAMAHKVATIAADASCYPEVTAGGAELVELNTDKVSQTMLKYLSDDNARTTLGVKGAEVAAEYTWAKTADETIHLLENLL